MIQAAYQLNGYPISREDFYRIACDPGRSVAVEACAGAGKTWILVSRILRALLAGAAPHEILAITFTKKAAGEMRQRLAQWLEEFSKATPEQLEQELLLRGFSKKDAQELSEPLRNLYPALLAQGRPVQIRTFHSWFASLLRSAPLSVLVKLGLPTTYELLEDDGPAVAQVWRPFYGRLLRESGALQDYEAVVASHGRFQTERALAAALQRRVEFALADEEGTVLASVPHFSSGYPEYQGVSQPLDLLLTAGPLLLQLHLAAQILGRAKQPSYQAKGSVLEQALMNSDANGVLAALLTQAGVARKFGDKVDRIEQVVAVQAQLLDVMAAQEQHLAWQYQQRMTRLTRLLIAEFTTLKRERGWVDMNDIETAALYQLSDPILGGWVQERLDARTSHLLIDEFQDSSPLQWQTLKAWLTSYAGIGGGKAAPSLFIVGDPKQSIYRFRRAEPQVFVAAQKFMRELGADLLCCDHTRRNAAPVLALVNQVMGQAQAEGLYAGFRSHTTASLEAGATYALPQILRSEKTAVEVASAGWRDSLTQPRVTAEETLRTLECRQAARWLGQQIEAGLHPRDVMVLARKRDRLSVMQDELRALGIASQQPENSDLGQAPEVQDLVALLDALVSPAHDLSLARALKSPLFGLDDDALVELALLQREHSKVWFDLLQEKEILSPVLLTVGPILMRWKGWLGILPPHDALHAIFEDGDVLARFVAAAPVSQREVVQSHLQALLAASLQLDGGRYTTPYALVRALRRAGGVPAPRQADAETVRLLTVHGAKGLEAALVLLLDTDAPAPKGQTMGVLLDWPGEARAPTNFVFLASESNVPPSVQHALATEQIARHREELNTLYVAMTRAQQRLVLSSVQPHQSQGASWWQRLQPGCTPLWQEEIPGLAELGPTSKPVLINLPVLPVVLTFTPLDISNAAVQPPATLESRIGQAMHRLLQWAALDAQGWESKQVQRVADEFGLDQAQAQQSCAMAQTILQGEGAWVWRTDAVDWHANEVTVTVQGSVRRIDRLVRRVDGAWWVLDYKSAAQPQAQQELLEQLHDYRLAVQASCPGETVRAAFLSARGRLEEIL